MAAIGVDDYDFAGITIAHPASFIPEQHLILAILDDALRASLGKAQSFRTERSQADAQAWVSSRSTAPFSFIYCCEVLNLDVDGVRRWLASGQATMAHHREVVGGTSPRRLFGNRQRA